MPDDIVKRLRAVGGIAGHEGAAEIERLRSEVERLTRERDEAQNKHTDMLKRWGREIESLMDARDDAERKVEKLREALAEAIAIRVKLYRNSDFLGEDDHLSAEQIAKKEAYARKWSATLAETEKE